MTGPRLISALLLLAVLPGCSFYARNSIRGIWADCNSFGDPALILEKRDHLPYHRSRVHHYRWMYDMGPVLPTAPLPPRPPIKVGLLDGVCEKDSACRPPSACSTSSAPPCAPPVAVVKPAAPGLDSPLSIDVEPVSTAKVQWANQSAEIPSELPVEGVAAAAESSEAPKVPQGAWLFGGAKKSR